jgi:hypothetical protein
METETIIVDGDEHQVEARNLTLLLHRDEYNIEVPDRFEINPKLTLAEIDKIDQKAWAHISTGDIFKLLFGIVFPEGGLHKTTKVEIPAQLEDLRRMSLGVQHVAGLIILAMTQGGILGKQLFFRLPEAHLHPAYQGNLADMFMMLGKVLEFMHSLDSDGAPKPIPKTPMEEWLGGE